MRYKTHVIATDIGETPLLIPGIYPGLEHELVDLNVGLDSNSSGEWLPRVLLDFIEVSLLPFDLRTYIGIATEHNFCRHRPFNHISGLTNYLVFSFSRVPYPQLTQIIQVLLSRSSSII